VTYTLGAATAVATAIALDVFVLRTRLVLGVVFWAAYPVVLLFQLLFNGVLAAHDVVAYDPRTIIGLRIAYAPVEDMLFGFALVLITLVLWTWFGARGRPTPPRR
jgi:lycopene cyclase domain-containing protein